MSDRMAGNRSSGPARPPTGGDASIVLQFARWSTELGMTEAWSFLWPEDFATTFDAFRARHPAGSPGDERFLTICRFYETVGTLWKYARIDEGLLFDWLAIALVWERLSGGWLGTRERRADQERSLCACAALTPLHASQ